VWRWVVAFFTKPVRISDIRSALQRLRERRRHAAPETQSDFPRIRPTPDAEAAELTVPSSEDKVEISEQPFHTLPADLQDEFSAAHRRQPEPPT